jgi:hypothetical protein
MLNVRLHNWNSISAKTSCNNVGKYTSPLRIDRSHSKLTTLTSPASLIATVIVAPGFWGEKEGMPKGQWYVEGRRPCFQWYWVPGRVSGSEADRDKGVAAAKDIDSESAELAEEEGSRYSYDTTCFLIQGPLLVDPRSESALAQALRSIVRARFMHCSIGGPVIPV